MLIKIYEVIITYPEGHFAYMSNGSPVQYICAIDASTAQARALGNAGLTVEKDRIVCLVREFKDEGS